MFKLARTLLTLVALLSLALLLSANLAYADGTAPTGKHRLNIPWTLFRRGDVLLQRDANNPVMQSVAQSLYWTHTGLYLDSLTLLDSKPTWGVDLDGHGAPIINSGTWNNPERFAVKRYTTDLTLGPKAAESGLTYYGLPWNSNYLNKWTTSAFYNSQLVWRAYYNKGVDLDSNYSQVPSGDVVTPDDIAASVNLQTVWDSARNMNCPSTEWKGQYFTNTSLSGLPAFVFCDSAIDFDWGLGGETASMPSDDTSVRWTRVVNFATAGKYTFHTKSDDGIRLWIDGKLVINKWYGRLVTEDKATVSLLAGNHILRVEYFDHKWLSSAKVWWDKPVAPATTPQ